MIHQTSVVSLPSGVAEGGVAVSSYSDPYSLLGGSAPVVSVGCVTNGTGSASYGVFNVSGSDIALTSPAGFALNGGWQVLLDGTSLASGVSTDGNNTPAFFDFNADGSLNTAFGSGGEVTGPSGSLYLTASQSADGSIFLQGSVQNTLGGSDPFLEKLTSGGQPDTTFGAGSSMLTAPEGSTLNGIFEFLDNGGILAGATTGASDGTPVPEILGYNADGSVNTAFGASGAIMAPAGVGSEFFFQDGNSGDIVVLDTSTGTDGTSTAVSTYYTPLGQVDSNFPATSLTFSDAPIAIDPISTDGFISLSGGTVTLLSEDFSNGNWSGGTSWSNNGVTWNWQLISGDVAPTEFESYSAYGAPDRGMPATEGGFEVASSSNDGSLWAVTADITLPAGFDTTQPAQITFDAGYRDNVTSGQFEIYNVTQGVDLLAPADIAGSVGTWTGNSFSVDLSQTNPGDVLELRWLDSTSNSWSGLEVGSVNFTASAPISVDPLPVIDPPLLGLTPPDGVSLGWSLQTLQDGTSLVSGWSTDGAQSPVLVDYNPDGTVNTAFGTNGELTGPAGSTDLWATQNADGSLQVVGSMLSADGASYTSFLSRYTASGQLDLTFGGGTGMLQAPEGESFTGNFQTLTDGSIVASAISTDDSGTPVIIGYSADGTLNPDFGSQGLISGPDGTVSLWAVDQGDGTILVSALIGGSSADFSQQDAVYSDSGELISDFTPAPVEIATGIDGLPILKGIPVKAYSGDFFSYDSNLGTDAVTAVAGSSGTHSAAHAFSAFSGVAKTAQDLSGSQGPLGTTESMSATPEGSSSGSVTGATDGSTYVPATYTPSLTDPVTQSASALSFGTIATVKDSTAAPASASLVVSPSFDPSVLGSGALAAVSALKLAAASESADRSESDAGLSDDVAAAAGDATQPLFPTNSAESAGNVSGTANGKGKAPARQNPPAVNPSGSQLLETADGSDPSAKIAATETNQNVISEILSLI